MAVRPVHPRHGLRPLEDRLAAEGTRKGAVEELAQHLLRLADQEEIDELGQRLGIEKRRRPPCDDQRRARAALPTPERNTGQTETVEDVQVIALERDRERHHVEVADGAVLLEGPQRTRPRGALAVGQEGPVTGDARILGQEPEHGLEAEVRHPDRIRVRVDQTHRQRTARARSEEPALRGQAGETAVVQSRHRQGSILHTLGPRPPQANTPLPRRSPGRAHGEHRK